MDDAELQRRKDLCTATIERIARDVPAQRPAPSIRYVDKLSAHGRFVAGKNEIQIGIVGDLGDPAFDDSMIVALAAHEMGHWADPTLDATMRRSQIICNAPFVLGVLTGLAIALHAAITTNADQVYAALAALVFGVMLQVTLSPLFDWKGEFFADRFAAVHTSPDKVVALLTRFGTRWMWIPTPTHPSRAQRVRAVMGMAVPLD
ncbi:UNVERIFIED_ORG: hypothetical protein M2328_006805 [Rhodococcus erythropolis]